MSKKLMYLLGILATILIGTYFYLKLCCGSCAEKSSCKNKEKVEESIQPPKPKTTSFFPFTVKDADGDLSLSLKENFNFKDSRFNFSQPVPASLNAELVKLKDYVTTKDGKSLSVTGYYTNEEKNNSAFPNLGLARANSIKNYLVKKGIPSKLIDTHGELKDDMVKDGSNVFHGPLAFGVSKLKDNSKEMASLLEEINNNPLILYFKTGQASINLTPEQRKKIANISKYLDKVDTASCLVTGHTDNTGGAKNNMVLGQNRANFAKEYLVKNAIQRNRIVTASKGQTEPIASNTTNEGKALNRRTVITVK